jgi:putative molybdopterin biosynthesis protein
MSPVSIGQPRPAVAYALWRDSLTRAGWDAAPTAEQVPVADALGRVSAQPIAARWPSPRSDCSAMDGIAVRAALLPAGDGALRLPAGSFTWIDTGDPMPDGTDAVVIRERLIAQDDGDVVIARPTAAPDAPDAPDTAGPTDSAGAIDLRTGPTAAAGPAGTAEQAADADGDHFSVSPGKHVRRCGEDFAAGDILIPAGRRLRPGDLAAAAAGGLGAVPVACPPVVAIIPTGDEIRPLGSTPRPGEILDTNSLMLAARCRQLGAAPTVSPVQPDDPDALAAEIRRCAPDADLVLVIAGSSRGRGDHTAAVLAQVGGLAVTGVAVRPGHPALLGHVKHPGHPARSAASARAGITPVIGLPGYPLATTVIFELFAAPLLSALQGALPATSPARSATLDQDWSSPPGIEDWVLVTLTATAPAGNPLPVATPSRRGAGSISQLARADAWWPIPPDQTDFAAGDPVTVIPLPDTLS